MGVTIYDIGKKAGKSGVAVSLALKGSPKISKSTREKILKIAKELNYEPNLLARGLVGGKTKTWSFVFNFPSVDFAHDFYFVELFSALAQQSSLLGFQLLFEAGTGRKSLTEIYNKAKGIGIEGIILATNFESDEDRKILENTSIPTILLNRNFHSKNVTCVLRDDLNAAILATEHLVNLGYSKIGFLGSTKHYPHATRFKGFNLALERAKIKPKLILETDSWNVDDGEIAGFKLAQMKEIPSAIVVSTDLMAIGLIAGLTQEGITVPENIKVIGFDNVHISRFYRPSLSSVGCDFKETSKIALDSLIKLTNHEETGKMKVVKAKLFPRVSTDHTE